MDIPQVKNKLDFRPIALVLSIGILLPLLYTALPPGLDWIRDFRPAALAMLRGESPYGKGFYNPPWILLPLIPLALLPERTGRVLLFVLTVAALAWILQKLRARPLSALLFLTATPAFGSLWNGNLDAIAFLGAFLPAPFGLLLAVVKPQVAAGLAVFWAVEAWREGGLRRVISVFLPLVLLGSAWVVLYGLPVSGYTFLSRSAYWNMSLFPYEIPIGLFLLYVGIRDREKISAAAASPFVSPYIVDGSLIGPLALLLDRPRLLFLAWVLLWIPRVLEALL